MREDVHVGLYIASLVALIPAIIIFFSYKYVIKICNLPKNTQKNMATQDIMIREKYL